MAIMETKWPLKQLKMHKGNLKERNTRWHVCSLFPIFVLVLLLEISGSFKLAN